MVTKKAVFLRKVLTGYLVNSLVKVLWKFKMAIKKLLKVQIQQIILQTKFLASQQCNSDITNITASTNLMSPSFPQSFVPFGSPPRNVSSNGQNMNRTDSPFRRYESL